MITFSPSQLTEIAEARNAINSGLSSYDATPGEDAKINFALSSFCPLLKQYLGLFKEVVQTFESQQTEAALNALAPWTQPGERERVVSALSGIRMIHSTEATCSTIISASDAHRTAKAFLTIFDAILSAPQNQAG